MCLQERHKLVISEYSAAKSEAVAAKAVGNKARQQHAGKLIRDLKAEMASLGAAKHTPAYFVYRFSSHIHS